MWPSQRLASNDLESAGQGVAQARGAALRDKGSTVREAAAKALGRISAKNGEAVPLSNAPAVVRKEHKQLQSQLLTILPYRS
jgi:hypothetical protein